MSAGMIEDDFDNSDLPLGRLLFPQPPAASASGVLELAENALIGIEAEKRSHLLNELDKLLNAAASELGWHRALFTGGCTVWSPINGGVATVRTDIDIVADRDVYQDDRFAQIARQIDRDSERAVLKLIALVVIRDHERGDYRSVVKSRPHFDEWSARLISRDEHTHQKRREGGRSRGRDMRLRKEQAMTQIEKHAKRLEQSGVAKSEWVSQIDTDLNRGSDAPYPNRRTIRRILKEAGRLS
jgi:hypothetical protein